MLAGVMFRPISFKTPLGLEAQYPVHIALGNIMVITPFLLKLWAFRRLCGILRIPVSARLHAECRMRRKPIGPTWLLLWDVGQNVVTWRIGL